MPLSGGILFISGAPPRGGTNPRPGGGGADLPGGALLGGCALPRAYMRGSVERFIALFLASESRLAGQVHHHLRLFSIINEVSQVARGEIRKLRF